MYYGWYGIGFERTIPFQWCYRWNSLLSNVFNTSCKMRAGNAKQYHIISWHITSYHIIWYHIMSYHVMSCHVISYHIISYHIISYHIISYRIIYHIISYTSFAYHGDWERFFTGSVYFAFEVMLSIRFYTEILSNTTRTHVAVSFNRWKANLSQSSFSTFKLKFNGYFKTRIAKYSNSSSYFQLSRLLGWIKEWVSWNL